MLATATLVTSEPVPHVVRMLIGTDHKKLIPVTALTTKDFYVVPNDYYVTDPETEATISIVCCPSKT